MEEPQRIDLTYITERIITIFCPPECPEEIYLQNLQEILLMLQSKHGHHYMLINLSQKHETLTQRNHKILDTGWVDLLAPDLDQMVSVCSTMKTWLQTHPKHVLVLHCRGAKGQLGVLVASYIHFSNMSASADLSLDHFAMRRFYNDKLSALMTPSQKRYVWILGSTLKGALRMCPSPTFLLCVVLHGLPKIKPDGACSLFLRVYQSLQAVCTSAVYHVNAAQTDRLYFVLQPAQLLKGDIMVVCYDKNSHSASRQVVFRLQFHTGLVHGHTLTFSKADLDCASEDPRFPEEGKVELWFSDSPEKITGRELWHNGHYVTVDYDTLDPLVRRDSYQDASPLETAPPHVLNPGVRKNIEQGASFHLSASSPGWSDRAPSASSDSGLSVASHGWAAAGPRRGAAREKGTQAGRLFPGVDFEIVQPLLEVMTELAASGRGEMTGGMEHTINGEASSSERETDILDDEDEVDGEAAPVSDVPSSSSICSLSSANLPETQTSSHTEYSTHSWVRQQQMVDVVSDIHLQVDGGERLNRLRKERPPPLVVPGTPPRGFSSREAVQRGLEDEDGTHNVPLSTDVTHNIQSVNTRQGLSCQEEDLSSLTTDIDESIEQLNQLILDLDPTFIPVPTSCAPQSRSASLHTNGLSHKGNTNMSDSRSFLDSLSHAGVSAEGELFRSEVSVTPASCQRIFGSMCSMTSDSSTPPVWHDRTPNSLNSPYPPQPSPPLSLSTPNAHSSPRGALRGLGGGPGVRTETDSMDLSSLLGNGSLEHSLMQAMEGLGSLNFGEDGGLPPLLPEKKRVGEGGELGSRSPSLSGFSSPHSGSSLSIPFSSSMTPDPFRGLGGAPSPGADFGSKQDTVKFVQDTSKFWYKPGISRDQAIAVLKDKEPGSFIVRDSHSFRGAYGLAMKVATPPPSVLQQSKKAGDLSTELVRHFLIECTQKGVRLKGCPNEPYFGSLTALVCQHSITPLALPCKLILPDRDPVEDLTDSPAQTATNSAAELLKQGAACNVWYLGSVELESLTGHQAVQKAAMMTLSMDPPPPSTIVHFKVSAQGITLTDNQRKLFFRRHYAVNTVIFCSLDPQGRKWTRGSASTAKIFGFVARKAQSETENVCHLFAEHDPEQPASAIVNFVSKVMIGSHKK
ncbi:hypothetical protein JOQ06_005592 [Pogonophryne albipinna]|uniref:Tensin 3 n=1 Tax=Pogonophryne albipinna TaxID=1090488 RepID=A0AAD6BHW5_9TELE|nr:hypothetical protein JOQ06_005592 [Pogonophryne albipinna]